MASPKDPALAALLGFFFGPLGLLYSTVAGAAITLVAFVVVGLLTFGLAWILVGPVSAVVGYQAAKSRNQRAAAAQTSHLRYPATVDYAATLDPHAGWYPDPYGRAATRYWDGAAWTAYTA